MDGVTAGSERVGSQVDRTAARLAEGYGWLVGYDYAAGRSRPLPDDLREKLAPELRDPVG